MTALTRPIEDVIEDVADLVSWGVGVTEAAQRVGAASPEALTRRLQRAGRHDLAALLEAREPLQVGDTGGARAARARRGERRAS